jgi:hypothetical protein
LDTIDLVPSPLRQLSRRTVLGFLAAPTFLPVRLRSQGGEQAGGNGRLQISGIYPHLAVFNDTGGDQDRECGIGAVVPWADRLWLTTYPPHRRTGSPDKLYEIDRDLRMTVRPESVGGTHAGRLVHRESRQLVIGPYFVDEQRRVRAVDQANGFPARITAVARHLIDPASKVYVFDMEGPVWEVDVHTLRATRVFVKPVPGWHGKGAFTGQGRFVIANNGARRTADLDGLTWEAPESTWTKGPEDTGALAEFDGETWTIVSRRSYTEVTGPGGVNGESNPDDPVWSLGWDKRSVLLQVRAAGAWHTYRLPKGSYTYDPSHGWFTEWPRIREIGAGPLLMNMHGTFFDLPPAFAPGKTAGIRPLATHLHYTTDFCEWNGRIVLAGDDTSILQNLLAAKPQSNLRFVTRDQLARDFGPRSGWGGVWVNDRVAAAEPSDPLLITGYPERCLHLVNDSPEDVTFSIESDAPGSGQWSEWATIRVAANSYAFRVLPADGAGDWLRLKADREARVTAQLHYSSPGGSTTGGAGLFTSLAPGAGDADATGGLIRPAGFSRDLQFLARPRRAGGRAAAESYYEIDERLQFVRVDAPAKAAALAKAAAPAVDHEIDAASVLVVDGDGRRWRLPRRSAAARHAPPTRGIREVISERYLAHFDGTFYEIPREGTRTEPDFRRMKPIASHRAWIADFCTWRGLLVIAGTRVDARPDGHYFRAAENGHGLWFGAIDDLYALGVPEGEGGPWKDTTISAGRPSDPYLMTNYGRKSVAFEHDRDASVRFTIEVDFLADDSWHEYTTVDAPPGRSITHDFPAGYGAHWVRITANDDCQATAWFTYRG